MTPSQLRVFLAVVESGSIRAAARKLAVSSPAVTKSIRQLERELHVRLLERTQHGVVASPAGRALAARARVVESELRKVEEDIAQFAGAGKGSVALGAGPTAILHVVPDAIEEFRREYPDARIRIVEGLNQELLPRVRDETLDFALGLRPEEKLAAGLEFKPLFRHEYTVAAREGHPLRTARSLAELAQAEWLTLRPRVSPEGVLERVFSSAGLSPPPGRIECNSLGGMVALLARTDMVTLMPRRNLAVSPARDLLEEIPIAERMPSTAHGMFLRTDTPLTKAATAMAKAVTAVARRLASRK